jgi:hypothetical protein
VLPELKEVVINIDISQLLHLQKKNLEIDVTTLGKYACLAAGQTKKKIRPVVAINLALR